MTGGTKAETGARPANLEILTGLRGIAAWAVVLYHVRLSLLSILPQRAIDWLAQGFLAVDLFFILSGFVIWYTYAPRMAGGAPGAWRQFFWRRFARIWPLHAVTLAGFVAFAALLHLSGRDAAGYPLDELPLHFLLIQNWGFTADLTWNHPAWSISAEAGAYLLFPLLVMALAGGRRPLWLILTLAAALLAGLALLFAMHGHTSLGADIPRLGLMRCLAEFSLGSLLCILWQRWSGRGSNGPLPAAGLGGAALLALTLGVSGGWPQAAYVPLTLLCALAAMLSAPAPIARLLGLMLARGPLHYLGEISYSTYLAHFGLFILYKLAVVDATLQLGWVGLCGYLLLVLATSITLYHGLEKPAQRWLNAHPPRWVIRG